MPKRVIEVSSERPLLDVASYARPGPGRRDRLSAAEIEHISLTVRRAPEVMIKVLSAGGQDLHAVQRHIAYVGRYGELEIETDDGRRLQGSSVGKELLEDWDLDVDEYRRHERLAAVHGRRPPKLVHKVLLSMPPGTPPDNLLAAVHNFAREQFALQHRYALVLHTDEPHPHVHMIVKAVSERGVRLNIRKSTLRDWRREFAKHLRLVGVAANATERAVRGESRVNKSDGIYRAAKRVASTHLRHRIDGVASEIAAGGLKPEPGKLSLVETRKHVHGGWQSVSRILFSQGHAALAAQVRRFADEMTAPRTENESIAADLLTRLRPSVRHLGR